MSSSARRPALLVAAALAFAKLLVHLATLRPYGFFRDELYYIACSRHLDWGYVDHPPLSLLVLRLWRAVAGESLAALRVAPALLGAAAVFLCGLVAIELGGGALAVALAGTALIFAPQFLFGSHYYSMNSFDLVFWTLAIWLLVRIVDKERPRLWPWLGLVLGLGLENKLSVLWLGAGLAAGIVATSARGTLRTRGPWIAVAIALLLLTPHLFWQAQHGFPTLEFMRNAMGHKYIRPTPAAFFTEVVNGIGWGATPIWLAGVAYGVARRGAPRLVAVAFLTVLAILLLGRTKTEYLMPAFPALLACGGVAWERWLGKTHRVLRAAVAVVLLVAIVGLGVVAAPFALPVLSEERFIAYGRALGVTPRSSEKKEMGELPQHYADMHGWPELVAEVARAYATLSPEEKPGAIILVLGSYGVAAAIEELGRPFALPPVACGHNNYWLWGPGHGDGKALVIVGGRREQIAPYFRELELAGTFECRYCMPYENHKPIYIGRGLLQPLEAVWPSLKNFE